MLENQWDLGQVEGAAVSCCYSRQVCVTDSNGSGERSVSGKGLDNERFGGRKSWDREEQGGGLPGGSRYSRRQRDL